MHGPCVASAQRGTTVGVVYAGDNCSAGVGDGVCVGVGVGGAAVEFPVEVDGAMVPFAVAAGREPYQAAARFCHMRSLGTSMEGLGCANLLAQEVRWARYDTRCYKPPFQPPVLFTVDPIF